MFKSSAVFVLITLAIVGTTVAEGELKCNSVQPMTGLELNKILGKKWFVIQKGGTTTQSKCGYNEFKEESDRLEYVHTYIATEPSSYVTLTGQVFLSAVAHVDGWKAYILDTDYDNYLVLYSCSERKDLPVITIMSLKTTLDQASLNKAEQVFKNNNKLASITLWSMSQVNCPKHP